MHLEEVCPPGANTSQNGRCKYFQAGYAGIATLPEAWTTYYCDLSNKGYNGVTRVQPPR